MSTSSRMREGLLLALALSVTILAGCDSNAELTPAKVASFEQDAEAVRFVRGFRESLAQQRRPDSADVQCFKAIANQYPDESFMGEVMLSILPALRDWDGLASYYEHKAELDETERALLARVYIKQADYAAARDIIQPLANEQPDNVEANALLGHALYFFEEYDEAARCYDRVWDSIVATRRVADITYRGMIEFDRGHPDRAIEILQAGLKDSPDSIAMHNALGRVLAAGGRLDEARVHNDRATQLQDELSQAETGLMLRASRVFALNRTLQTGDMAKCQRMIFEYLPVSDANFQQELYRFLEGMYQTSGREVEIPAVLERARQVARKGR